MSSTQKLIQKLLNCSLNKADLGTLLTRLGFSRFGGRGSHEVWGRRDFPDVHIVIATHSKDVPSYQLKQVEKSLRRRGLL